MKIKVEQFCSLSTSPSWQSWLYHFDGDIYKDFIEELRSSSGCGYNRELMKRYLDKIDKAGGGDKLIEFLVKNYPYVIDDKTKVKHKTNSYDEIFPDYNPSILTYPRRTIFSGSARSLKKKVTSFLIDKIKSDYIIVGDKAYVEYLERHDSHVMQQIPMENWLISQYRLKK